MATYYVRPDGSDANTGLGSAANQAWRTIQKALGATGVGSGDTVYIGPGLYGEQVTIGGTYIATTYITGDPTASQFSGLTAGNVQIGAFTNLSNAPIYTGKTISGTSKNNLYFSNIEFLLSCGTNFGNAGVAFATSANLTFDKCVFQQNNTTGHHLLNVSAPTSTALNLTVKNCVFSAYNSAGGYHIVINGESVINDTTSVTNTVFMHGVTGIYTANTTLSVTNCTFTFMTNRGIEQLGTPILTLRNSLFHLCALGASFTSSSSGTQTYCRYIACGVSFVGSSASATSSTSGVGGYDNLYSLVSGASRLQPFSSIFGSPNIGFGTTAGAPTTDMYGVAWAGVTPDAGSATYRSLSSVGSYFPVERNSSTITIAPGETSRSLYLYLGATGLTHTTTNLTASYTRNGQASVPITLVAQTPTGSNVSGGFCEVSAPYARGTYRLDVPNAAFDFGADDVTIFVGGANTTNGAVVTCNMQGIAGNIVHIGPFKVIGDGLGSDQPLDIVQGVQAPVSVQLVDANENGVDISGATVEAKVYNAIGSLIATYSCVPVYAADGRCTFQLTTSVTNTAGVYNVTLTRTIGGNIVVFGPMKMIVRAN